MVITVFAGRNGILPDVKKHIYIYSPSSAVRDKASFRRGVKRLAALGYEVEIDASALTKYQRFAGDDETRLAAINRAAASGADIALISRGGYGLTRILPAINYKAVAKAIDNGTRFVGISDFTAVQMALLAKSESVTWAGPSLGDDFGTEHTPDDIMEACFNDLMIGQGEGTGWKLPKPPGLSATKLIATSAYKSSTSGSFTLKNSVLWGGNLSILVSLIGTPYFPRPQTVKDGILFIEDVGEHPYRVERCLSQLLHADVLANQQAIIFGQFSNYKLVAGYDSGFNLTRVAARLQRQVKAQVLMGLPFGHVATKVMLPVGAKVTLAVDDRDALIVWGEQV